MAGGRGVGLGAVEELECFLKEAGRKGDAAAVPRGGVGVAGCYIVPEGPVVIMHPASF